MPSAQRRPSRHRLRIGLVCPYSFDVPGGVQYHVRDLAARLLAEGHQVSVLAPADGETRVPAFVEASGRAVPVPYNGSVARLAFGPLSAARVRRWLADHELDLLHLHEPLAPSLSLLALWSAEAVPIVATVHTATARSRAMQVVQPVLRPSLEKISAWVAVSEEARSTLVEHLGRDAVVIPNGVDVDLFARAQPWAQWRGTAQAPTVAFVGRIDEPRKGLGVLAAAAPAILARRPGTRFLVLGPGDAADVLAGLGPEAGAVRLLGALGDPEKAALLRSADVFVAPHTGGESFGIVLVEAMSAGVPVVAADLPAFRRVLDDGRLGRLFPVGDSAGLARAVLAVVDDAGAARRMAQQASAAVWRYDWSRVTGEITAVYETVLPR
jgi:phosphatidyl-myo-inositol alpha-mannosyltransferase